METFLPLRSASHCCDNFQWKILKIHAWPDLMEKKIVYQLNFYWNEWGARRLIFPYIIVLNLARLCLAARENFLALKKYEKLWCHSVSSQKWFLQWKILKIHIYLNSACISFCHSWWSSTKFDMKVSGKYVHMTWGLRISESFLDWN